jgi:hypothetical protein
VRPPLPLPPRVDPDAIADFDYRRVTVTGRFRHDQEMLIGPRMREGEQGYIVVTPLEREGDPGATVLVNRGWVSKKLGDQKLRPDSLPTGEVTVEGLLRQPWKKNMFTPENRPDKGEFYFPDVKQMAALTGSQAVWVEQTIGGSFLFCLLWLAPGFCTDGYCLIWVTDTLLQSLIISRCWTGRTAAFPSGGLLRSICETPMRSISSPGKPSVPASTVVEQKSCLYNLVHNN